MNRGHSPMTFADFHNTILASDPSDWYSYGTRWTLLSDIDIVIEYNMITESVLEYPSARSRFASVGDAAYFGEYRLLYRGQLVTGSRTVNISRSVIPFPYGFDEDFQRMSMSITELDKHVGWLISQPISVENYVDLLKAARVVVKPYYKDTWKLKEWVT